MVFQDYALFEHMSVRDNIGFGIHQDPNRDQRVDELLQLVSLEGYGDRSPSSLSGGQQQRVALVRALAPRPSLLVLDEPFANLDGPLLRDVSLELKRVLANQRVSALLVTHERGEALGLADRVAILDCPTEGRAARLVQTGTPEQVYDQPATAGAAVLSGFVCFVSGSATGTTVATPLGTLPISTPREGACRVVLRPEQIKLLTGHGQSRVSSRRFEGGSYEIEVDSPAGLLVTSMPSDTAPSIGSQVEVHIIGSCHTVDP
jgi:iron(III) transport system ATP-binding protein